MNNVFQAHPQIDIRKYAAQILHNDRSRPAMIICETVNMCNNNCIICPYRKMTRAKQTMPMDLFEKVLQDYSDMGGGKLSLTPEVGDLFLDHFLTERVKAVKRFPAITGLSVTTNAAMAHVYEPPELGFIVNSFERIYISVYGIDEEEYSAMTKRNSYSLSVESIRKVLDVLSNPQAAIVGFRFLKEHTVDEVRTWMLRNLGRELPYSHTYAYANWGDSMETALPLPFAARWMPAREHSGQCLMPLAAVQVFSNGNVSYCPCPDFDNTPEFNLGNLRDETLQDLYNSEKVRRLWDFATYGVPSYCRNCTFHIPLSELPKNEYLLTDPIRFIGG